MITDECRAHGLGAVSLRYFNVAGASGDLGEDHEPETHLIPLVLQAAAGRREHVSVFGTDYPTPDGTAVRDYIHIEDLGEAHILGLEQATNPGEHRIYNLGNGTGFSVRQVIEAARAVTGREIPVREEGRRPGDPAALVASSQKIRDELGWVPKQARDRDDDRRRLGVVPGAPRGLRRLTAFLAYARKMISRMTAITSAAMAMVRVDMVPPPVAGQSMPLTRSYMCPRPLDPLLRRRWQT